ncbi:uromodulin-like [Aquarana catesbeiana]|uniref:uromodulin-like n=1 Tax=Aquarana catesbeiana TaxID=8400 RepID=UPI003CC967C4
MKLLFFIALPVLVEYAGAQCIDPSDPTYADLTFCDSSSCSGDCTSDNGCSCSSNRSVTCVPTPGIDCTNSVFRSCCPEGLFYNKKESCCSTFPFCDPECATDEVCNSLGICECNTTVYRNLRLSDFHPTVICDNNAMIVTVSKCELAALGLDSSTIHLRNSSIECNFPYQQYINGQTVTTIQASAASNWCGNTVMDDDSNIYISNTIYIGILDKPVITTNNISFNFICVYNRNMQTSLKLSGNIIKQMVFLSGVNGTGSYPVTMAAYKDSSFTEPYQNDEGVAVGSIIYVGIFVTGADGNQHVLRIETCVASPTDNRSDVNAFYLIKDGCVQGTVSTTVLDNGKALEAGFSVSSFQFQNRDNVNLFCDVRLCDDTTESCFGCTRAKSFNTATNEVKIGLTLGATYADLTFCDSASCTGSCTSDNGCSCSSDPLLTCVPTPRIDCPNPVLCCPDGLFYNKNQSCCSIFPFCETKCATDEVCNSLGICECNTTVYRNLKLSDFHPTVTCENRAITVTVSKCELEALGLDSSTIHLRDPSNNCNFPISDTINGMKGTTIQAQAVSNWCGNTVTVAYY